MVKLKSSAQNLNERLGADCVLPIEGNFKPTIGVELLLQDIQQLLLTMPGERVNRPNFGCNLKTMLWENIEDAARDGRSSIQASLTNYEPRITVLNVSSIVNQNTSLITFKITFRIKADDSVLTLVFPFRVGSALSFA